MRRSILFTLGCAILLITGARAMAQEVAPGQDDRQLAQMKAQIAKSLDTLRIDLKVATSGVLGPVVTGAPYAGVTINESIQTLADGNRIVQRSTYNVARDAQGRVRREELAETGEVRSVMIMDPVANASCVLDPASRTARKVALLRSKAFVPTPTGPELYLTEGVIDWNTGGITLKGVTRSAAATASPTSPLLPAAQLKAKLASGGRGGGVTNARRESLGTQNVEGVVAEGTRTVSTIPAGQIGNERPIDIVSEEWYSKDLQMIVMSRHSDPRTAETTYRVTNIRRGEPDPSLFQVPSDYTVTEMTEVRPEKVK